MPTTRSSFGSGGSVYDLVTLNLGGKDYLMIVDTGSPYSVLGLLPEFPFQPSSASVNTSLSVNIAYTISTGTKMRGWLIKDISYGANIHRPFTSYILAIDQPAKIYGPMMDPAVGVFGLATAAALEDKLRRRGLRPPADLKPFAVLANEQGSISAAVVTIVPGRALIFGPPAYEYALGSPSWLKRIDGLDVGGWAADIRIPMLQIDQILIDTGTQHTMLANFAIKMYIWYNPGAYLNQSSGQIIVRRTPKMLQLFVGTRIINVPGEHQLAPCIQTPRVMELCTVFRVNSLGDNMIGKYMLRNMVLYLDYTNDMLGLAPLRQDIPDA
ncbi:uncharacterized protein L969DRAFT_92184 [Mixia osmundae IAM 14324]|uniref:Peptidase A1 domain-containing protein n=1 Tax=Mixia osmundae (strain CBS 9802 / IAM 14324 / JCM 22182 / KY 12970) TaxID=764103 RepID=G7DT28_MIXOS|nr:uncharacterized protein L969DRAFT_92184 [Mixia osmundae IAM 14324]KEI42759.1 hypothetical protein L969DRAFT_92184 [Mixia osmundae IAM 14324]GAA93907.1 hypothetical protein E5Q_00553 [Mixia osmundae IAM 14324]